MRFYYADSLKMLLHLLN